MTPTRSTGGFSPRSLISLDDLTAKDLEWIVERGAEWRQRPHALQGAVVGIYFTKTSTRTRTAFSSGALRLGAAVLELGPEALQLKTGETLQDTGRVFAGMLDAIVARTAGDPSELRTLAAPGSAAVINAMTADEHPTQALADLSTILRHRGEIERTRLLYVGEGNNTATALARALPRFPGTELHVRTPAGYGLDERTTRRAREIAHASGAVVDERHDMGDLPDEVDFVYTTRWQTTGTTKDDPDWREAFAPFAVDEALMARYPKAAFMHDLPAHRDDEVAGAVLDGSASIAWEQATTKMWSAMSVLEWALGE